MSKPPKVHPFTIDFTVYYTVQPPADPSDTPPTLILVVHGWGQNARSYMRNFKALQQGNYLVVAPQGPHQFYLDPGIKKVGFNWLSAYEKENSINDINHYFHKLIQHVGEEHPFNPQRIFLLGFSQGVSMASRFAVSGLVQPTGLICCGADLAPDVAEKLPQTTPYPVYLAHGKDDELIPRSKLEEAEAGYKAHGFSYEVDDYDGGHEITPELMHRIQAWIDKQPDTSA